MNDQQHSRADALTDEQLDAALAEFELAMEADPRNTDYARNSPTWPRVARAIRKDALYAAILAASPVEQHEAAPAHKRCVGWAILNGVCVVDFSRDGAQARSMAREMQRSHDLSGSLAAFHVEPVFIVTGGAEGVRAWETDDGRVISNEQKQQAIRDGGASASSVRPYAHALGRVVPAQAAKPVAVPAGWKLVPVAPTPEMCCAMEEAIDAGWKDSIVWARGIAAAPQPPAQADAREGLTDEQRAVMQDAARSLSVRADELKEYNTSIDGEWCDADEKAAYDAEVRLVERLRAILATQQPEPRASASFIAAAIAVIKAARAHVLTDEHIDALDIAIKIQQGMFKVPEPRDKVTDERIARLREAIEGECDGLAVDYHHARAILEYVDGDAAGTGAAS